MHSADTKGVWFSEINVIFCRILHSNSCFCGCVISIYHYIAWCTNMLVYNTSNNNNNNNIIIIIIIIIIIFCSWCTWHKSKQTANMRRIYGTKAPSTHKGRETRKCLNHIWLCHFASQIEVRQIVTSLLAGMFGLAADFSQRRKAQEILFFCTKRLQPWQPSWRVFSFGCSLLGWHWGLLLMLIQRICSALMSASSLATLAHNMPCSWEGWRDRQKLWKMTAKIFQTLVKVRCNGLCLFCLASSFWGKTFD